MSEHRGQRDVFICFAPVDEEVARRICAALEGSGIRCWIASRDATPEISWTMSSMLGLCNSELVVLVYTAHCNVATDVHCLLEIAISHGIQILPFKVDNMPRTEQIELSTHSAHWIDATAGPLDRHLPKLVQAVRGLLNKPIGESQAMAAQEAPSLRRGGWLVGPLALFGLAGLAVNKLRRVLARPAVPPVVEPGEGVSRHGDVVYAPGTPGAGINVLGCHQVDCTVFAPPAAARGKTLMVQVFAHLTDQGDVAGQVAREFDEQAERRGFKSLGLRIEPGARLLFQLTMPGLKVDEPIQALIWHGPATSAQFGVAIPSRHSLGTVVGTVTISLEGVPIGHIKFKLTVTTASQKAARKKAEPVGDEAHFYRQAFVSYATPDRREVLKRVQMLARLGIRCFQDVLDLEPGERWERALYRHIDESDLFLLFWSAAAKRSKWVLKEVRYALQRKGSDEFAPPEIMPVPLEGPPPVAPPQELAHLHFGDPMLYFMGAPDHVGGPG